MAQVLTAPAPVEAALRAAEIGEANPRLVPRPRLVHRLVDAGSVPVVLLLAPAGYGKTALLTEWDARDPRDFAWVTLDDSDNDPATLLSAIALALEAVEPVGWDVLELLSPRAPERPGAALRRLVRSLGRREVPVVLVLDDLHVLHTRQALVAVAAIAQACGHGLQLALAARSDEGVPVARLRAHGKAVVLRGAELAMTRSESAALLRRTGVELSAEQALTLHRRTEGWPAGLHLAALTLAEAGAVDEFGGGDRLVGAYVRDEFLSQLPDEDRDFLIATSVLDRLDGPACNAVLGCDDAAERLARLAHGNALLIPLDRRDSGHRHHELFATALRAELHRREPGRAAELHRRACDWYRSLGDTQRALGHAVAARDVDQASHLLWESALPSVARGDANDVSAWLERFGHDDLATNPLLALSAAAVALGSGDFYEAERWITLARSVPGDERAQAGALVLRAALGRRSVSHLREDAEAAAELLEAGSAWRVLALALRGVASSLAGDSRDARELLEEAAHLSAARMPLLQAICLSQAALLAAGDGDLERATLLSERARAEVGRWELGDAPPAALVYAVSARMRVLAGGLNEASADLRQAQQLLLASSEPPAWLEAEACLAAAESALRLSGPAAARKLLGRASGAATRVGDACVLTGWLQAAEAEIDAALESGNDLDWSLTAAELRVLHHLPSHLSFREIAALLFVSQNTVKTHARGIYRKLGVASRGEAVELARDAGLVTEAGRA